MSPGPYSCSAHSLQLLDIYCVYITKDLHPLPVPFSFCSVKNIVYTLVKAGGVEQKEGLGGKVIQTGSDLVKIKKGVIWKSRLNDIF